MFITSNQGRPIQGVSQQPEKTRLPGQCTLSENLRPDVVRGLINRQGTITSAVLSTALLSTDTAWHHYKRGDEEYFISIENGTGKVRAWSPDGTVHIVNVQDNTEASYLNVSSPKTELKMMTIGDYTFMVNTTMGVLASSILSPAISNKAIVYVQFVDYGQRLQIFINNTLVSTYCTPDGSDSGHKYLVRPEQAIITLATGLEGGSGGNVAGALAGNSFGWAGVDIRGDFSISINGNILTIERKDGADFTINVNDDVDNANATAIKGKIKNTTLLPGTAPDGFLVEVDPPGSSSTDNANYFLRAEVTGSDHVTWREALAPGISVGPDKATMPHVLVRESVTAGVATFTLRQGEWEDREVGSERTNPHPTFIGEDAAVSIESIGLFQNRLFFTSGESVIMTRSADFFNFYRETAQASLDTDPIDIFADVPEVNIMSSNVSFDGDLVLFSNTGQFILDGSKPITSSNATLRQTTSYESETTVDPVASGDSILFAFNYGRYTGVREFFTDSVTDTKKARPVTDHVKQYIEGKPQIMKTSTNVNLLVIKTDADDNVLYTYDWLWSGAEKVQSAWGKIRFQEGSKILHFEFEDDTLWILMIRDNSYVTIEKVDLGDPPDAVLGFPIRLDRVSYVTWEYDTTNKVWKTSDPFNHVSIDDIVSVRTTGAYESEQGTEIDMYREGSYLVTEEELADPLDTIEVNAVIGVKFMCKYIPTNPVALDENGYALNLDRLTVGAFYLNYNTSGEMLVTVESDNGSIRESSYINRTLGGPENLVGFAPLVEGQHRVSVRQKADRYKLTFSTDSYLPLEIRDLEYNGNLSRRGRRI